MVYKIVESLYCTPETNIQQLKKKKRMSSTALRCGQEWTLSLIPEFRGPHSGHPLATLPRDEESTRATELTRLEVAPNSPF